MKNIKLNFHILENCNAKCQFCFRKEYEKNNLTIESIQAMLNEILKHEKINYINIAGGEPLLLPDQLFFILEYLAKHQIKSSIITNGLILINNDTLLEKILTYVDTLGISVDSLDHKINKSIGRYTKDNSMDFQTIEHISQWCQKKHKKFKINIVANQLNLNDPSLKKLSTLKIDRLKILKNQKANLAITDEEFNNFVTKIKYWFSIQKNCKIVVEKNMTNSYLMLNNKNEVSINENQKCDLFDFQKVEKLIDSLINQDDYQNRYCQNIY